jgi:hypothetical protein
MADFLLLLVKPILSPSRYLLCDAPEDVVRYLQINYKWELTLVAWLGVLARGQGDG